MTVSTKVKYDGKVLIPQEVLNIPINKVIYISFDEEYVPKQAKKEKALSALERVANRAVKGVNIKDEYLNREYIYEDRI